LVVLFSLTASTFGDTKNARIPRWVPVKGSSKVVPDENEASPDESSTLEATIFSAH